MPHVRDTRPPATRRIAAALCRAAYPLVARLDRITGPVLWRSWNARRLGRAFDRKYRTDTQALVEVESLGIADAIARHAVHYEASTIPKIRRSLRHLGIEPRQYRFVDVGSGKGLVCLLAARHAFRQVTGVEASADLHRIAQRNLEQYRRRAALRAPVEFVNANALDYRFAGGKQVVYLYNPFDETLLEPLIARLLEGDRERLVVVYVNPVHRRLFETGGPFTTVYRDRTLAVYRAGVD